MRRLGELDVGVFDDLDPIAPGIEKVEERTRHQLPTGSHDPLAHARTIIDNEPEVTAPVLMRLGDLHHVDELVAELDEGVARALRPKLEVEDLAVKIESLVDVADLDRDVIDADEPRLAAFTHRSFLLAGVVGRNYSLPDIGRDSMSVDLTIDGAVAKVVLNRPEKLNALSVEMRENLCDYFARLRFDDAVRVIIVTGAGRGFCSGADVDRMAGQPHDLRADRERMQRGGHTFIRALHAIEKPVIAAVRGPAVGIGWSIALACDLVVASKTARFSQIFRRIGLAPDGGAIWFLTRRLGMAKAKELVFSARFVEAEEALALGLVNHVVEDDELMTKTEELAADLADAPTFALGLAKKLFHAAVGPSLESYLEIESLVQPQLHMTADNAEGVAAFREKRKPKFIGR